MLSRKETTKMLIYNLVLPILCYALGVFCGVMAVKRGDDIRSEIGDEDIQHVGYTHEQMGYDK